MGDTGLSGVVADGPLLLAVLVAAFVGVVGFASPCVLPLVPGYLSYVTGLSATTTSAASGGGAVLAPPQPRVRRVLAGASLFVLGFSAVFVAGGALFGQLGSAIQEHLRTLEIVFGAITVVLGLAFLGLFRPLQRELKVHRLPRAGLLGAPLLGATFGLAWTPCLTPTFSAVATLSVSQATAGRGALLAAAYCVGLGVPFLLIALGVGWMNSAVGFLRRHAGWVSRIGGGMLVLLGVLMITGVWVDAVRWLQLEFGNVGVEL